MPNRVSLTLAHRVIPRILPGDPPPSSDEMESSFKCPITQEVMIDPVFTDDGQTYERAAIQTWFIGGRRTSPATGLPLRNLDLKPNHALRSSIEEFRKRKREEDVRAGEMVASIFGKSARISEGDQAGGRHTHTMTVSIALEVVSLEAALRRRVDAGEAHTNPTDVAQVLQGILQVTDVDSDGHEIFTAQFQEAGLGAIFYKLQEVPDLWKPATFCLLNISQDPGSRVRVVEAVVEKLRAGNCFKEAQEVLLKLVHLTSASSVIEMAKGVNLFELVVAAAPDDLEDLPFITVKVLGILIKESEFPVGRVAAILSFFSRRVDLPNGDLVQESDQEDLWEMLQIILVKAEKEARAAAVLFNEVVFSLMHQPSPRESVLASVLDTLNLGVDTLILINPDIIAKYLLEWLLAHINLYDEDEDEDEDEMALRPLRKVVATKASIFLDKVMGVGQERVIDLSFESDEYLHAFDLLVRDLTPHVAARLVKNVCQSKFIRRCFHTDSDVCVEATLVKIMADHPTDERLHVLGWHAIVQLTLGLDARLDMVGPLKTFSLYLDRSLWDVFCRSLVLAADDRDSLRVICKGMDCLLKWDARRKSRIPCPSEEHNAVGLVVAILQKHTDRPQLQRHAYAVLVWLATQENHAAWDPATVEALFAIMVSAWRSNKTNPQCRLQSTRLFQLLLPLDHTRAILMEHGVIQVLFEQLSTPSEAAGEEFADEMWRGAARLICESDECRRAFVEWGVVGRACAQLTEANVSGRRRSTILGLLAAVDGGRVALQNLMAVVQREFGVV